VFAARPVVGGEFAILALNGAPTSGYVVPAGDGTATSGGASGSAVSGSAGTTSTATATSTVAWACAWGLCSVGSSRKMDGLMI